MIPKRNCLTLKGKGTDWPELDEKATMKPLGGAESLKEAVYFNKVG